MSLSQNPLYSYSINQETKLSIDGNAKDVTRTIKNYPINYRVSFDMKVLNKAGNEYMSIFHVTSNDSNYDFSKPTENSRNPGLWMNPNDTSLAVGIGIPTKYQVVLFTGISLKIGEWYNITIDAVDANMSMITRNLQTGVTDTQKLTITPEEMMLRVCHATSVVQIADKWYESAPAVIRNFQIFDYTNNNCLKKSVLFQYATNPIYVNQDKTKSIIFNYPKNYEVSFVLTPLGLNQYFQNILLITSKEGTSWNFNDGNNSRNPGIWFYPNSFRLHIPIGIPNVGQTGNDPPQPLEANKRYSIRIRVNQLDFIVEVKSYDDNGKTYNYMKNTRFDAFSGRTGHDVVYLYIGAPFHSIPANAMMMNLKVESLGDYVKCEKQLTDSEAYCYNTRYEDVRKLRLTKDQIKDHWSTLGCAKGRDPSCPQYQEIGCYKEDVNERTIKNKRNNVQFPEECAVQAQMNGDDILSIQNGGECWTDNSATSNYGSYGSGQCGDTNVNKVFQVLNATTKTLPSFTVPKLSGTNFSSTVEPFANEVPDLRKGDIQLYNQLFCDIAPMNNGFITCENCGFDDSMKSLGKVKSGNAQDCLNRCKNNNLCTSYTYDLSSNNKNCTLFNTFPNTLRTGQQNKSSGYSLQFPYNYKDLTSAQKDVVQKKCMTQYMNYALINANTGMESCLSTTTEGNTTNIITDKKCVWSKMNQIGRGTTQYQNFFSLSDQKQLNPVRDALLDTYDTKYKNVVNALEENENANDQMSRQDYNFPTYTDEVKKMSESLDSTFNSPSTDTSSTNVASTAEKSTVLMGGKTSSITESFSPSSEQSKMDSKENKKYVQFLILILMILLVFSLFVCFKKRK